MTLRSFGISFILLSSTVLLSCSDSDRKKDAQQQKGGGGNQRPPVRAEAMTVSTSTLLENIEIPGSIVANETAEIHPEVAGLITGVYFKEGTYVSKGSMLFKLNDAGKIIEHRSVVPHSVVGQQIGMGGPPSVEKKN